MTIGASYTYQLYTSDYNTLQPPQLLACAVFLLVVPLSLELVAVPAFVLLTYERTGLETSLKPVTHHFAGKPPGPVLDWQVKLQSQPRT